MLTKDVTITSKNQITLPMQFVEHLHLAKGRVVSATLQGNKIILENSDDLSSKMQKYWSKRNKNVSLSDEQLKNATRSAAARRVAK